MSHFPIIGITAEWNPFHRGHAWMIENLRDMYGNASLIGAMSGSFVQRGEPALFDKWTRSRWALKNGMDAVVELPVVWTLQSADRFAAAGVELLAELGVTHIAFGTESLASEELTEAASWTLSDDFRERLRAALAEGASYAEAHTTALSALSPRLAEELTKPNNLLGMRYVETIVRRHFPIAPIAIRRDMTHNISASTVREELLSAGASRLLPDQAAEEAAQLMREGKCTDYQRYEEACLLASRLYPLETLTASGLFTEGLEHKWYKETLRGTYTGMLDAIKSKRYLYSRLKRTGAQLLLSAHEIPSAFAAPPAPCYARLLALRKEKSAILRESRLPLITSAARARRTLPTSLWHMFNLDIRATNIAAWCRKGEAFRGAGEDYFHSPVIL